MRVLLDANVYVSYLLTPGGKGAIPAIVEALGRGAFTPLLPEDLLEELSRVVTRKPRLAARITPAQLERLRTLLLAFGEVIPRIEQEIPAVSRDRKNDYLLAYAVVSRADFLVTGDEDLLVLKEAAEMRIVSPPVFAEILSDPEQGRERG